MRVGLKPSAGVASNFTQRCLVTKAKDAVLLTWHDGLTDSGFLSYFSFYIRNVISNMLVSFTYGVFKVMPTFITLL